MLPCGFIAIMLCKSTYVCSMGHEFLLDLQPSTLLLLSSMFIPCSAAAEQHIAGHAHRVALTGACISSIPSGKTLPPQSSRGNLLSDCMSVVDFMQVQHLDGHMVVLKSTGITIPGQLETVKGQGMPLPDSAKRFGDLHVTYTVEFPKTLSESQKKCIHDLRPNFTVRDEL